MDNHSYKTSAVPSVVFDRPNVLHFATCAAESTVDMQADCVIKAEKMIDLNVRRRHTRELALSAGNDAITDSARRTFLTKNDLLQCGRVTSSPLPWKPTSSSL